MGAVTGLRLAMSVANSLQVSVKHVKFWCDSMNKLWWIRGHSRSFRPFVANRVGEIQSMTSPEQWRYDSTKDNPADHLTRGMASSALACNEQWWKGSEFLRMDEEEWPPNQFEMSKDAVTEQKQSGCPKVKSAAENHEENLSLFADAVSTTESTIEEPMENKPIKASEEDSWYLDPSHFSS